MFSPPARGNLGNRPLLPAADLSFRATRRIFPRVPLAVPYWNRDTTRGILRAIFSGNVIHGQQLAELKSVLTEALGADVVLCGSGSLALELALRACSVGAGDEVVVPTFCCTSVMPAILSVGAVPVLADIGDDLNVTAATVDAALSDKTKAIIVPHLFGNPADIGPIVELARDRNFRVIDDAAQALGATIDDRPVGSFGDAGILSFRSEKICAGLGGGAVITSSKEWYERLSKVPLSRPRIADSLHSLLSTTVWHRWRRWTLPLEAVFSRRARSGPESPPERYKSEAMGNLNAAVALTLVRRLRENVNARRERARAYGQLLGASPGLRLTPHESGSAFLAQVIRVLPQRDEGDWAAHLIESLDREGYEVQGSYVPIHLIPAYRAYQRVPLPNAERLWPDLIELPCDPQVSLEDVERIAGIVKRTLGAASRRNRRA